MKSFVVVFLLFSSVLAKAQAPTFYVLEMPSSAASSALSGVLVTTTDPTPSFYSENPALLNDSMEHEVRFNYLFYFAGTSYLSAHYAGMIGGKIPLMISGHRFSYGDFDGFDDAGNGTETFGAGDNLLQVGTSFHSNNFTLGLSLKYLHSTLAGFSSHAIMTDVGVVFTHPEKELVASVVVKNAGVLLTSFTDQGFENALPFDVKAGITYKPENMPFRFTFTGYNIVPGSRSILYDDTFTGVEKFFSYFTMGGELILSEQIQVLAGYNFQRRFELRNQANIGGEGFSFGIRMRNENISLEYARARYHIAGISHNFTLGVKTSFFQGLYKNNKR